MDQSPLCICNTIKHLEDNMGENLGDIGFGDAFLHKTPKKQSRKIIDKLNFINVKTSL